MYIFIFLFLIIFFQVSHAEALALANQMGIDYIETSAKNKINVENVFHDLVRSIRFLF